MLPTAHTQEACMTALFRPILNLYQGLIASQGWKIKLHFKSAIHNITGIAQVGNDFFCWDWHADHLHFIQLCTGFCSNSAQMPTIAANGLTGQLCIIVCSSKIEIYPWASGILSISRATELPDSLISGPGRSEPKSGHRAPLKACLK